MRSLGSSGAEYQSVMITPPNGSADCSGRNDKVSRVACQRKELTPSVRRPLDDEIAVVPVPVSGMSLSLDEPQPARTREHRTIAGTRIEIVFLLRHSFAVLGRPRRGLYWPCCARATPRIVK